MNTFGEKVTRSPWAASRRRAASAISSGSGARSTSKGSERGAETMAVKAMPRPVALAKRRASQGRRGQGSTARRSTSYGEEEDAGSGGPGRPATAERRRSRHDAHHLILNKAT